MDKELAISQHVKASTLEEVNLGTDEEPQPVSVAKEMQPEEKMAMVELLKEYKDVFCFLDGFSCYNQFNTNASE